jgi:hypothetical protein
LGTKGWKGVLTAETDREEKKRCRGEAGLLTRERAGTSTEDRRSTVVAGEGESPARVETPETLRRRGERQRKWSLPRARAGKDFLKTEYGRTGQSTVPVRCTPDNAQ